MSLAPNSWRYEPVGWSFARCPISMSISNFGLDASTDALEFIFPAPDFPITRVGFRQGTVVGTAPTYRVSIQGTSGTPIVPDGTIKSSTNAYADVTPVSGGNSTWQWLTLGASYTPAVAGEMLSMVIKYQSGTINGSNYCTFANQVEGGGPGSMLTYFINNNAGSRSRGNVVPLFAVGGDGGRCHGVPISAVTAGSNVSSSSTPDEIALRFRLPPSMGAWVTLAGLQLYCAASVASSQTALVRLYTDSGALLASHTADMAHRVSTGAGNGEHLFPHPWPRVRTGEWHRLAFAPQSTSNWATHYFTVGSADDLDAYPLGTDLHASTRTDAGAWTDVPERRYLGALLLADIEPAYSPRTRPLRRHL